MERIQHLGALKHLTERWNIRHSVLRGPFTSPARDAAHSKDYALSSADQLEYTFSHDLPHSPWFRSPAYFAASTFQSAPT